jgi:hypothetical protein
MVAAGLNGDCPGPEDYCKIQRFLPWDRCGAVYVDRTGRHDGSRGFRGPLRARDYTVWTQELATRSFAYRYTFVLSVVPEPAAGAPFRLGLPALRTMRRRRPPAAVTPIQSSE